MVNAADLIIDKDKRGQDLLLGKGAFGKSAKMEIDLRSIEMNGRRIPIQGHFDYL